MLGSTTDPAPYTVAANGLYRITLRSYSPGSWDKRDCEAACDNHHDEPVSNPWPGTVAPPPDTGTLTGRITDEGGVGISGATVVTDGGDSTLTDSAGYYSMTVDVGTYSVTASESGYYSDTKSATVNTDQSTTVNFTLAVAPVTTGSISGTVNDADSSAAVVGASVTVGTYSTTTASDGTYTLTNVEQGTYAMTVSKTGYEDWSGSVSVTAGSTTTKNVALSPVQDPGNLAFGKSFSASRYEDSHVPANAGDGDMSTYWWSNDRGRDDDEEWLRVDLGSRFSVDEVQIAWDGDYYARRFRVYVSRDGSDWDRVYETEDGRSGTSTITFRDRDARYVYVECRRTSGRDHGYRISELRVYEGTGNSWGGWHD
jgi:hypothetical protein